MFTGDPARLLHLSGILNFGPVATRMTDMSFGPGSTILVQASGKQAREALDAITTLVENGFDEDSLGPE